MFPSFNAKFDIDIQVVEVVVPSVMLAQEIL